MATPLWKMALWKRPSAFGDRVCPGQRLDAMSKKDALGQTCVRLVPAYQDGGADGPCRFPSHCDRMRVPPKGLDVFLHPPQGCQLVQEAPVAAGVCVPSAVDQQHTAPQ